ncbi:MAG: SdpI family protein [Clostridia bacterium]|nr:SdpI family protein [Clostridia bacterium]
MDFLYAVFASVALIPAVMIVFGAVFSRRAPKRINRTVGYRTRRSMMNRETWEFAHQYSGKRLLFCGLAELPLSVIPLLFVRGGTDDLIGGVCCAVMLLQLLPLLLIAVMTERALKREFDENGNRRDPE